MIVDTSALVAILYREPEALLLRSAFTLPTPVVSASLTL